MKIRLTLQDESALEIHDIEYIDITMENDECCVDVETNCDLMSYNNVKSIEFIK